MQLCITWAKQFVFQLAGTLLSVSIMQAEFVWICFIDRLHIRVTFFFYPLGDVETIANRTNCPESECCNIGCIYQDNTSYITYWNSLLQHDKQGLTPDEEAFGTNRTLIFLTLCISFLTVAATVVVLVQYSQRVRVAPPWLSRTALPRRALRWRRCTRTSLWDRYRRRTRRMRTSGSLACSWRRGRPAPRRRPLTAQATLK